MLKTMTPETFDQTLRQFIKRKPFEPFVVELKDGRVFTFQQPWLSFGGGVAGFLSEEDGLVDFGYTDVLAIRAATAEVTK